MAEHAALDLLRVAHFETRGCAGERAAVADLAAYERLLFDTLLRLPHVSDVRSNFVLRTIKEPGPLPV